MSRIRPELIELLACPEPACRARLAEAGDELVCAACGRRYPIEGSWPVLIPEEAVQPQPAPPAERASGSSGR